MTHRQRSPHVLRLLCATLLALALLSSAALASSLSLQADFGSTVLTLTGVDLPPAGQERQVTVHFTWQNQLDRAVSFDWMYDVSLTQDGDHLPQQGGKSEAETALLLPGAIGDVELTFALSSPRTPLTLRVDESFGQHYSPFFLTYSLQNRVLDFTQPAAPGKTAHKTVLAIELEPDDPPGIPDIAMHLGPAYTPVPEEPAAPGPIPGMAEPESTEAPTPIPEPTPVLEPLPSEEISLSPEGVLLFRDKIGLGITPRRLMGLMQRMPDKQTDTDITYLEETVFGLPCDLEFRFHDDGTLSRITLSFTQVEQESTDAAIQAFDQLDDLLYTLLGQPEIKRHTAWRDGANKEDALLLAQAVETGDAYLVTGWAFSSAEAMHTLAYKGGAPYHLIFLYDPAKDD